MTPPNALRVSRAAGTLLLVLVGGAGCAASANGPTTEDAPAAPIHSSDVASPRTRPSSSAVPAHTDGLLDACIERVRKGTLTDGVPPEVEGLQVRSKDAHRVTLGRTGRALAPSEGDALWQAFRERIFAAGVPWEGSHATGAGKACSSVANPSCFEISIWACQTPPERVAGWMREAAEAQRVGDAEIELQLRFLEPAGPRCKEGPKCVPTPHYSTKSATYDPTRERRATSTTGDACKDDGDCEGPGQSCSAWYRQGGPETLVFVQLPEPTFCGCVSGTCSWFTQP